MPFLDVPGGAFHYVEQGEGDAVVLVHASGFSGRQWRRLADRLARAHRVLVPDLLGSGASPPWTDDRAFTIALDVDVVRAMVALAGGRAHPVGHSYGGLLGLLAARDAPASVRSLAVYEPVVFGVLDPLGAGRAEIDAMGRTHDFLDEARGGDERWWDGFIAYWNGEGAWAALPEPQRAEFLRVGRKVFREVSTLNRDPTSAASLAVIDAPTLVLSGERTTVAEREVCDTLARALPRAARVVVPGAGHMGPLTHGGLVNDAIAAHVAGR